MLSAVVYQTRYVACQLPGAGETTNVSNMDVVVLTSTLCGNDLFASGSVEVAVGQTS